MSFILSLETSTDVCSVALHHDSDLIKEIIIQEPQAHASRLSPLIQEILHETGIDAKQLNAVAVSSGPGSYTGLRIGTSTAKGLCYALDIPLIAVPTLELMAYSAKEYASEGDLLCPMIDARRMEVYAQIFRDDLTTIKQVEAVIIDNTSFAELLHDHKLLFFGNGAEKCKSVITNTNAVFIDEIIPTASVLGTLALKKLKHHAFEDLAGFTPFYLKDFVAKKAQPLI